MNDFENAKKMYESVEIPQELDNIVKSAIGKHGKKKTGYRQVLKFAPLVACAAICLAVGINFFAGMTGDENTVFEDSVKIEETAVEQRAMAMPRMAESETAVNAPAAGNETATLYDDAINEHISRSVAECVAMEKSDSAYADMCEIYSDDEYFSYSITSYPSGKTKYYNINKIDGSDVYLDSFFPVDYTDDEKAKEDEFYIAENGGIVLIKNGEEIKLR